jgi:hypothetical protein
MKTLSLPYREGWRVAVVWRGGKTTRVWPASGV